jgi:hypothetical protein
MKFQARERSFFLPYGELNRSRLLKRVIQKEILDPLRLDILEGQFHEGQTIRVDAKKWRARVSGKISVQENVLGLATGALTSHIFSSLGHTI